MTNRVLVAGGTGTLDQVVVDQLLASGADVRVLSRRPAWPRSCNAPGTCITWSRRRKLADEQLIAASGLPWTVLRATQFHDLIAVLLRVLAKSPVLPLPTGWSFQPVDVREVGDRLARLALGEPVGRAPDIGGPQIRAISDLARSYLAIVGKRRPILPVWLPGRVFRAYRAGGHLAPEHANGTITFEQYLTEQLAAGDVPYSDAIHDYLHLRRSKEPQ